VTSLLEALRVHAAAAVAEFYTELAQLPKSRVILDMLDESERHHLQQRQIQNLLSLANPRLKDAEHVANASRIGRIHAIVGLDKDELVESRGILAASVFRRIGRSVDSRGLSLFTRRLSNDLAQQLKAYQKIESSQQAVLLDVTKVAWGSEHYGDLIRRVVDILAAHEEIAGCAIGRPDDQGVFHFEAAASESLHGYLEELLSSSRTRIVTEANDPRGQGTVGRAWRSGNIERIINFKTLSEAAPWREQALKGGFRSSAAVPLGVLGDRPLAILLLYSALPGGFMGANQTAFLDMLQTVLNCALERLGAASIFHEAISISQRQRFAALVRSEALLTYYQPLLDTREGKVTKVEALARLEDGGQVLSPAQFLPALVSDDLLEIYVRMLEHALAERLAWLDEGFALALSINLPPTGLSDIRYLQATESILAKYACPPDQLTLEVLETQALSFGHGQHAISARFKTLGVAFAQDDLGAGASGLARLRELPFDWIKIDRDMVKIEGNDAFDVLRFIYQLTHLGHAMGKRVVAEGVESMDLAGAFATLGVDLVQGYAIAKPMPGSEVAGWMRDHSFAREFYCEGMLARLARLLAWEERITQILDVPATAEELAHAVPSAASLGRGRGAGSPLVESLIGFADLFPGEREYQGELEAIVNAALHQGGLHGQAYEAAHRRLVDAIASRTRASRLPQGS
jgi:EAL domain-containing protein (putative c-di-GMP-specific phosphodiesterase class I)